MEEINTAADSTTKLEFNTAWLRLRLALKTQGAPIERQEALAAMREAAKHLAIARLQKVFGDVAAYHTWVAEISAESTQTWQFIRLKNSFEAANYIRKVVASLVTAIRPTLVATSCR
jgi:hypothetical protein